MRKEERICLGLYQADVSVPFPIGVREIDMWKVDESLAVRYSPGFVMEFVSGKSYDYGLIPESLGVFVREELEKAEKVGFEPGRDAEHNFIWNQLEEKVVLVDFALWDFSGEVLNSSVA